MIRFVHDYEYIISAENILQAWKEFKTGKQKRKDVQEFERNLMENIFALYRDLESKFYQHSKYEAFKISDPKPRDIHKASVRDRILHHVLYRALYPGFDRIFIYDSYSCRIGKGTHKALNRFRDFIYKVSKNNTRIVWVLKCDIRKFFASVDHEILLEILDKHFAEKEIISLLKKIIKSFSSGTQGKGLPLGNLTSQILANVYLNELDQFIKHKIRAKYYIRYADDFVILSENRKWLEDILPLISEFLKNHLKLELHPDKIYIRSISSGVDFLGWIHFGNYRVLRTVTKRRMFRNLEMKNYKRELAYSYLGLLKHGNAKKLAWRIRSRID